MTRIKLERKRKIRMDLQGRGNRLGDERGSVLIAVIWVLLILAVFAVVINRMASQELLLGRWMKETVITRGLANAGIERALFELQQDESLTFDALNEPWASNEKGFKDVPLASGTFSVVCDPEDLTRLESEGRQESKSTSLQSKPVRYGVCDEAARVNVNTVDVQTLTNLFMAAAGLDTSDAATVAQSVIDWRDEDDAVQPLGAESSYYRFLAKPYNARNRKLESVEELMMIRGITPEIYKKVKPYVTVYTKGKVNFNSASSVVLQALGITPDLAKKIISLRSGDDGKEGTEDDRVFQMAEGITPALSAGGSFSGEEFKQITDALSKGFVTVKSNVFRIQSIGRFIRSGQVIESMITCVMKRNGTVLYWHEGNESKRT